MTISIAESNDFEQAIADWLSANCPASMRLPMPSEEAVWGGRKETFPIDGSRHWLERMADKGLLAPTWPVAYGGAGFSREQEKILQRQMLKQGCRPALMSLGIHMMGPTIMEFGSEAQKREHLPKIARGEVRWCQGYSEPGAGSDLASLKCRAEKDGDHYIVNGQKVWTSFADQSDFIFCLVRTDFTAAKHEGISVLLIDLDSPGVSVRPIELISGSSHFSEVFFDNVPVPVANLLGEENQGWPIAKRMLQHERNMMGQRDMGDTYNPDLADVARRYLGEQNGRVGDAVLRDQIAANRMQMHAVEVTSARVLQEFKAGVIGAGSSVLKTAMTLAYQEKFELLLTLMGHKALGWYAEGNEAAFTDEEMRSAKEWAFSKIQTIGGGTTEIQLNIIAKRILNLPD